MSKKPKKQTQSSITAKELKFWLKGILEFQQSDWVPNKDQWTNIKEKIFNLEDSTPSEVVEVPISYRTALPKLEPLPPLPPQGRLPSPEPMHDTNLLSSLMNEQGGTAPAVGNFPRHDGIVRLPQTHQNYQTGIVDTSKRHVDREFE